MAEGVVFNIAAGIIKILAPLVAGEIGLLWGVQDELKKLQGTVSTIKDVLLDAEEKQTGSHAVSGWLVRLSDLLYQADDLLDEISTEAQQQELMTQNKMAKEVRIFFSTSNQLVYGLKMGHKIKKMKEKFDAIAADITKFNFLVRLEEETTSYKKRVDTHSYLGGEMVIGRDDDKKKVMGHLMKSNMEADVSIISIVGLGGLGKTTLAKLIFDDEEIQNNFKLKIWVCVSDNFEAKVIIKRILESIKGDEPHTNQMDILVRDLHKEIDGKKKYLLVLDDLWNENRGKWDELKNPLMSGGKGSKILVTTRKENVANIMQSKICHLNYLGEEASWELFQKVAFENGILSEGLEEIGKVILKKCKGVPLAIKTIGKLLYSKSLDNWKEFINKELPKIPQEATDILPTLKLSYDDLPSHLKHCFAYCSIFPKDYVFNKAKLISLWIAQGYVESKENQCLEKIGHEYFMNLLERSFFQEPYIDDFGDIMECKMHDLMHDLAISVAKPLTSTFPFENDIDLNRIRHIVVEDEKKFDSFILSSLCRARMTRTFMVDKIESDWEVVLKHFKFLRVLCLRTRKLKCVLSSIGKLRHLRHLDLSHNHRLKKLPSSITTLVNLRLLNFSYCPVKNLPFGFGQLLNLRHFDASWTMLTCLPLGFGQLVNLRHFDASHTSLTSLPLGFGQLVNLRHFDASWTRLTCLPLGFGELVNLRRFDASWTRLTCLPLGFRLLTNLDKLNLSNNQSLKELPRDINRLVNLKHLNIFDCNHLSHMPSKLGQLTNLQVLTDFRVSLSSYPGNSGLAELNGLNKLRGHLSIRRLGSGKDVLTERQAANLIGKKNLNSLSLAWSWGNFNDYDMSMEVLQPHHNLKHLKLLSCWCPKHPSWLPLLTSLVSLSLESCSKWRSLAPLSKLPSLESLELEYE